MAEALDIEQLGQAEERREGQGEEEWRRAGP